MQGILTPHEELEGEVRALWQLCFGDDDLFLDSYFADAYQRESTLLYQEEGRLVAHLQYPQLSLIETAETIQAGYILAACTHPDYRGRGYMRELLVEALRREQARGDVLSVIIPAEGWLWDYYQRTGGYAPLPNARQTEDERDVLDEVDPDYTAPTLLDYLCDIEQLITEPHLTHTRGIWEVILRDYEGHTDRLVWAYRDQADQVAGAIFVVWVGEGYSVEAIFGTHEAREALLRKLGQALPPNSFTYNLRPSARGRSFSKGMIRILDMPAFLQYCLRRDPELAFDFDYEDEVLPRQNGHYHCVGDGKLIVSEVKEGASTPVRSTAEVLEFLGLTSSHRMGIALPLFFDR
nr:GNAT family N-acetyltransferase [uncultured Porphyromonas sp.]